MFRRAFTDLQGNGGRLEIPSGEYTLEDAIAFDYAAATLANVRGFSIEGSGSGSTSIHVQHSGAGFAFSCTSGLAHANGGIRGIKFLHKGRDRNGIGIFADNIAYWTLEDIVFYNLEYGIRATDILSSTFKRVIARANDYAVYLEGNIDGSPPNSITFDDCVISENYEWGLRVVRPRLLRVRGGSFEANGIHGRGAQKYAVKIEHPRGPVAAVIDGVYFTHNNGIADLLVEMGAEASVVHVSGAQFTRISRTNYVTNHIRIAAGKGPCYLILTGNAFQKLNTYIESAAEPYVYVDGQGQVQVHDNGNYWQTEALKGAAGSR